jgi:hypothetical protein
MDRPKSIVQFERLYLGAWLLGLLNTILNWGRITNAARASAGGVQIDEGFASNMMIASLMGGAIITVLLWYFVARRGSDIAKWIVTIFFGIGLVSFLWGIAAGTVGVGVPVAISVAALVVQGLAVAMLFRPDARAWFGEPPAGSAA